MNVNYIKIENDKEYVVMDVIVNDIGKYLILMQEDDAYDIQIRKLITIDEKECLSKLDSEEEFDNILREFYAKHKGKVEN